MESKQLLLEKEASLINNVSNLVRHIMGEILQNNAAIKKIFHSLLRLRIEVLRLGAADKPSDSTTRIRSNKWQSLRLLSHPLAKNF
jgi:hypothetical protein